MDPADHARIASGWNRLARMLAPFPTITAWLQENPLTIDPTPWLDIQEAVDANSTEAAFMYELLASINGGFTTAVQERMGLESQVTQLNAALTRTQSDLAHERQTVTRERETVQRERQNHAESQKMLTHAQKSLELEIKKSSNKIVHSDIVATPHRLSTDPEPFTGDDKSEDKRQEAFEDWETSIKLYWAKDVKIFPDNASKLWHMCSLLSGSARKYNEDMIKALTDCYRTEA